MRETTEVTEDKKPKAKPKSTPKQVEQKAPAEAVIYVGPTLGNGQLAKYTVFKSGVLPAHIQAISDAEKSVRALLIPVSKLARFESRLTDKTSAEASRYAEAKTIKGGK